MKVESDEQSSLLALDLFYITRPTLDAPEILKRVQASLPQSDFLINRPEAFCIFHPQYTINGRDGPIPIHTLVSHVKNEGVAGLLPELLQQNFEWKEAQDAIVESQFQVTMVEMMGRGAPPQSRVKVFNAVLRTVLEIAPPVAVASNHARRLIDPIRLLEELQSGRTPGKLLAHVHVRFYNISNNSGDMIMDTLGLDVLGLTDLQCHFRQLDPGKVAVKLYDTAAYLFENGPIIEPGNTLDGLTPGERWRCRSEESLLAPKRNLIDINPGMPYAAGERRDDQ